jgi:hypothetical protein
MREGKYKKIYKKNSNQYMELTTDTCTVNIDSTQSTKQAYYSPRCPHYIRCVLNQSVQ